MKQFNRFLDPKKDLGSFSGMVCLYLLVMVFVSIILTFAITLYVWTVWIGDGREAGVCRKSHQWEWD